MPRAYILIEVIPGEDLVIRDQIEKIGVKFVDAVHGEYDLVCVIEGELKEIDVKQQQIRKIPNIRKTVTLTALSAYVFRK